VVVCLQRGAKCLHMVQLVPLHPETPSSLASFKSSLVLPFWYGLTQVALEKRPLNGCSSVAVVIAWSLMNRFWTGQSPCRANVYKWGLSLAQSPCCDCGQRQTMNPTLSIRAR